MKERNQRVGAVMSANETEVKLFGFGVYVGDEIPAPGVKIFGVDANELGLKNPRIKLDNGKSVYGCECWWAAEEKVKAMIGDRKVVDVDIEAERLF